MSAPENLVAPIVSLGRRKKMSELSSPLAQRYITEHGDTEVGAVLASREAAKTLVHRWRKLNPEKPIRLNAEEVELASPSFFDELLKAWPRAVIINASEDVEWSFDLAKEHRAKS